MDRVVDDDGAENSDEVLLEIFLVLDVGGTLDGNPVKDEEASSSSVKRPGTAARGTDRRRRKGIAQEAAW